MAHTCDATFEELLYTCCMDKASHRTAFCAWDSSPHLTVTPAQLMRHGIDRNASFIVDDIAGLLSLFRGCGYSLIVYAHTVGSLF